MGYYIYKGSENSAVFNEWRTAFTVGKLYKGGLDKDDNNELKHRMTGANEFKIEKSDRGTSKWVNQFYFEEASAIEVIVYYLLIGVKYFTGVLGLVAFAAALTGAYHQFYVSALAFLLYYLQTKKIL